MPGSLTDLIGGSISGLANVINSQITGAQQSFQNTETAIAQGANTIINNAVNSAANGWQQTNNNLNAVTSTNVYTSGLSALNNVAQSISSVIPRVALPALSTAIAPGPSVALTLLNSQAGAIANNPPSTVVITHSQPIPAQNGNWISPINSGNPTQTSSSFGSGQTSQQTSGTSSAGSTTSDVNTNATTSSFGAGQSSQSDIGTLPTSITDPKGASTTDLWKYLVTGIAGAGAGALASNAVGALTKTKKKKTIKRHKSKSYFKKRRKVR